MDDGWMRSLIERGYAHFPRLVPAPLIARAHAAIADDLQRHYDPGREREYSARTYCPALVGSAPMTDLFERSPVRAVVDAALGIDRVTRERGQIAIRWAHNVDREVAPAPHLDGVSTADNGVSPGPLRSFTAIVGIFLTTTPRAFAGNLTVWPGTHRAYERYFRERGPDALVAELPGLASGAPEQLICAAGDVVLMHYALAHTASVNTSDVDRIAVYFRIERRDLDEHRWESLADLWRDWRISPSAA